MGRRPVIQLAQLGLDQPEPHGHHDLQRVYSLRGEPEHALRHAIRALELYRAEHNEVGEAHALNASRWQHAQLANLDLAREGCERASALHMVRGNTNGQTSARR